MFRVTSNYWCSSHTGSSIFGQKIQCHFATRQTLGFNNKDAIKGVPLKDTQSPQMRRGMMLLFLLHIAVHCQLFISYKTSMATGSICLPAWRPEPPDFSRRLAASYMQERRNLKRNKELPAESGCTMVLEAETVSSKFQPCKLCIFTNPSLGP